MAAAHTYPLYSRSAATTAQAVRGAAAAMMRQRRVHRLFLSLRLDNLVLLVKDESQHARRCSSTHIHMCRQSTTRGDRQVIRGCVAWSRCLQGDCILFKLYRLSGKQATDALQNRRRKRSSSYIEFNRSGYKQSPRCHNGTESTRRWKSSRS